MSAFRRDRPKSPENRSVNPSNRFTTLIQHAIPVALSRNDLDDGARLQDLDDRPGSGRHRPNVRTCRRDCLPAADMFYSRR